MNKLKCNICGKSMGNSNNESHIRCKIAYDKGFNIGLDCTSKSYLDKTNHILGCMLEGFENVLIYRGFQKEADMLSEVASKLK